MLENMREIGRVKLVQVQPTPLKIRERPNAYYDPSPLLVVDTLLVGPCGAIGVTAEGEHITDIHHAQHQASRNSHGKNDLSVGFTSHYAAMRARFGQHLIDGCAGENILVDTERPFTLTDLEKGLAIQNPDTGQIVYLAQLKVAAPCVEFSLYAANFGMPLPAHELQEALQFLHKGRRGFYARLAEHQNSGSVRTNDRVFIPDVIQERLE
jgi:hypothetical protein